MYYPQPSSSLCDSIPITLGFVENAGQSTHTGRYHGQSASFHFHWWQFGWDPRILKEERALTLSKSLILFSQIVYFLTFVYHCINFRDRDNIDLGIRSLFLPFVAILGLYYPKGCQRKLSTFQTCVFEACWHMLTRQVSLYFCTENIAVMTRACYRCLSPSSSKILVLK